MSYIATVYTHREDGASIVYVDNYSTGGLYSFTGSNSAGYKTNELSGDTTFSAIIPTGYKFKRWVYRLNSTSGTVQHNTANPFTYTLGLDIYIWAEIEEDGGGGGSDDGGDSEEGGANEGGTLYVYDPDDGWLECTPLIYADGEWNPVTLVVFGSDG